MELGEEGHRGTRTRGGFVFSLVCNIQSDVPPENIVVMFEAFPEVWRHMAQ